MRIMLSAALLAAGFALPVQAGLEAECGCPASMSSSENRLVLRLCETGECFALVAYTNGLEIGCSVTWEAVLEHEGFAVRVLVIAGDGRDPDRIVVTPPPGFIAEPPELDVEENTSTEIAILPLPMS